MRINEARANLLIFDAIKRVRDLHNQWHLFPDVIYCAHCSHAGEATEVLVEWPCPTLRALDARL